MSLLELNRYLSSRLLSNDVFEIIISILSIYNCRISEVLNAKWKNLYPGKFLILDGCKGSANIIIHDRAILKSIESLTRIDNVKIFPFITYYQVYHVIKRKYSHILKNIKHNKNLKITHSFRYINVSNIDNDNFIKDILHHNSTRSGKYYKNKLKGS